MLQLLFICGVDEKLYVVVIILPIMNKIIDGGQVGEDWSVCECNMTGYVQQNIWIITFRR